jgi:hypothetical protein
MPKPINDSLKHLHCASEECDAHYPEPMYNVAFALQNAGVANRPDWRCVRHIPPELSYPVSLHGDDWERSGRKKVSKEGTQTPL